MRQISITRCQPSRPLRISMPLPLGAAPARSAAAARTRRPHRAAATSRARSGGCVISRLPIDAVERRPQHIEIDAGDAELDRAFRDRHDQLAARTSHRAAGATRAGSGPRRSGRASPRAGARRPPRPTRERRRRAPLLRRCRSRSPRGAAGSPDRAVVLGDRRADHRRARRRAFGGCHCTPQLPSSNAFASTTPAQCRTVHSADGHPSRRFLRSARRSISFASTWPACTRARRRAPCYALDVSGLQQLTVSFFTVWDGDDLLGCGASSSSATAAASSSRCARPRATRGAARQGDARAPAARRARTSVPPRRPRDGQRDRRSSPRSRCIASTGLTRPRRLVITSRPSSTSSSSYAWYSQTRSSDSSWSASTGLVM